MDGYTSMLLDELCLIGGGLGGKDGEVDKLILRADGEDCGYAAKHKNRLRDHRITVHKIEHFI